MIFSPVHFVILGGLNCRNQEKRERLVAEVMGKLEFLRLASVKRDSPEEPDEAVDTQCHSESSVQVEIPNEGATPNAELAPESNQRPPHLASIDSL